MSGVKESPLVGSSSEGPYTPKSILVTGGSGFIASHVVELLVKKYPEYLVVNLDRLDYCATPNNNTAVADCPNYRFVKGNILSLDLVSHILKEYNIDTIMHFAAQTHVDNSFGNSCEFTKVNVLGTHNLLEAAKNAGTIRRFIHVSTDEVYGEVVNESPAIEERMLAPTNPYAASKAAAEFIVRAYATSFQFPVIITRGNNVFGPRQYPEKLIPKFIIRLMKGLPCCIHGDGLHTRNFLFVEDVARAFDAVLHYGIKGSTYNIGTDFEISNLEVARQLLSTLKSLLPDLPAVQGSEAEKIIHVQDRAFNDRRYAINSDKLDTLGWKQQVTWEEGLRRTVEWYNVTDIQSHWPALSLDDILKPHPVKLLSSGNV